MNDKRDISGVEDIQKLVDDFYAKVQQDELLGPIFDEHLSGNWGPHLEKMYAFWNAALLGIKGYSGNPFMKHAAMELDEEHFGRWLNLFNASVDTHFSGEISGEAKRRASIMAIMFQSRLGEIKQNNTKPIF